MFKLICSLGLAALLTTVVLASSGGQKQIKGGPTTTLPNIDTEDCELSPAPPQSGIEVYYCEGVTVTVSIPVEVDEEDD